MKRTLQHLVFVILILAPVAWAQEPERPQVRVTTDRTSAIPGQAITWRISVLVPTWMPKPPEFPNLDVQGVIIRQAKQTPRPFSERIGRDTWSGVSRLYLVYPMRPGEVRIAPPPMKVTVAMQGTLDPTVFEIPIEEIVVEGIRPEAADDLDPFIAARSVKIEQTIEGTPADLEPGDAFTRIVTVTVDGISPIFVPPLITGAGQEWIAEYPDEPLVEETGEGETIAGRRVERVTYVSSAGGRAKLPGIRLRWFNLDSEQIETLEVPEIDIASRGPAVAEAPTESRDIRMTAFLVLGALVVFGILAVVARRVWPRLRAGVRRRMAAYRASERYTYRAALRAIATCDFGRVVRSIDDWRAVAGTRPDRKLQDSLTALGATLYGSNAAGKASEARWRAVRDALVEAREERRSRLSKAGRTSALPPLNPGRFRPGA